MKDIVFNTGETPQELKQKYNPEGGIKNAVQHRLLDMLLFLDQVCKENDIDYRLEGGSVLGAVRHGGFIPWDDDIDVAVDNPKDYKRLLKILLDTHHEQYVLTNDSNDKGCVQLWSTIRDLKSEYLHLSPALKKIDAYKKFRGLQVDIFPFETGCFPFLHALYTNVEVWEKRALLKDSFLRKMFIHGLRKHVCNPVLYAVSSFFGDKNMYMHRYGTEFHDRYPKDVLLPHGKIMFEGYEFPCPANPERYLEIHYGNYMQLPPEEKRMGHLVNYKVWD